MGMCRSACVADPFGVSAWNYATKFVSVDSVTGASEWCTDSCVDVLLGEKCVQGVSAKGSACVAVPFGVSAWNYATKFVSDVFWSRDVYGAWNRSIPTSQHPARICMEL